MGEEDLAGYRHPVLRPVHQPRCVGMGGIDIEHTDCGAHTNFLALDAHQLLALHQQPPERAHGLVAGDQHRDVIVGEQALQVSPDAPGVAHAAAGHDDVPAAQLLQPVTLARLDEVADVGGIGNRLEGIVLRVAVPAMLEKHLRRLDGQW